MADEVNVPNFQQYDYNIGDTVEVVTKQNALNLALRQFGVSLNQTVYSINEDANFVEQARQELDADNIVHAPGSGLPNEAGTAYSRDMGTDDSQIRTNQQNDSRFPQMANIGWGSVDLPSVTDANDAMDSGVYSAIGTENMPFSNFGILVHMARGTNISQLALRQNTTSNLLYVRAGGLGGLGEWQEVQHSGNLPASLAQLLGSEAYEFAQNQTFQAEGGGSTISFGSANWDTDAQIRFRASRLSFALDQEKSATDGWEWRAHMGGSGSSTVMHLNPDGDVGINGLMSVGGSANHVLGAVLLDTVNLSGQIGTGTTLNIPTVFQGRLRKIVLEITAGISDADPSTAPLVVRFNGDASESYRSLATAYDIDNQSVGSYEEVATSFPRFGYLGTFHPSRLSINITPGALGSTFSHSWESRGWGNRGAGESQFLCQAGGRWNPGSAQQLSSVTVRSATTSDVWAVGGIAVLWGYPA